MDGLAIGELSLRGQKRKAEFKAAHRGKKPRRSSDEESDTSADSDNSLDDGTQDEHPSASTPLSPLSAKASPRFPSQLKTIACPHDDCEKTFNRPARLQEHLRSHTNTRIYKCPHTPCDKDFLRETHLKHHIKSAHTDLRDYVCHWDGCGKSFVTNTRLKRHHAAHEGREKFRCGDCGQSFRKHATLQRHTTTAHEGKAAFVCDEVDSNGNKCEAGFDTAGKLKLHRGRDHGNEQYRCTICEQAPSQGLEYRFGTYTEMQDHNRTVHPPTCTTCGLACGSSRELKRHVQLHHAAQLDAQNLSERQTHLCPEPACGKGFTKRSNLSVHIRTVHSKEKQFICGSTDASTLNNVQSWAGQGACGRGFTAKATLEQHVRTAHLGLENPRKQTKQAAGKKQKQKKKAEKASLVGAITGTGYEEQTMRNIACLVPGCEFLFLRDYDLDLHMRTRHGLGDDEILQLRTDPFAGDAMDTTGGEAQGTFVLPGSGSATPLVPGEFWLGGYNQRPADEWDADEMEMRALIDDNDDDEDDNDYGKDDDSMAIDPALY